MSRKRLTLSAAARRVLQKRYLKKNLSGVVCETPEQMVSRAARAAARIERKQRNVWEEKFYDLLVSKKFLPNSPALINAGNPRGQLAACFVLPIEDSLESIFETLKNAALIHQSGGGTGFSFSRLRPKGSVVRSSFGVASGPVSFMKIFDTATETIRQGGARRGANMGVLRVDHPDIEEFIESKLRDDKLRNFNISVAVPDSFMKAVLDNRRWSLIDPSSGKVVRNVLARTLFDLIVDAAWRVGDPGLLFIDKINRENPTPRLGQIETTNPCGEQPLLPYESCVLGSINVGAYVIGKDLDWEKLKNDVHVAVRFLDNIIDVNVYPIEKCQKSTLNNRKIGLGIMGFADALLLQRVPYESAAAVSFADSLMSVINSEARAASISLARERGAFRGFRESIWPGRGSPPIRNAALTCVAPTGTISLIAGASSGIEPIYAAEVTRNILEGEKLSDVHPVVARLIGKAGGAGKTGKKGRVIERELLEKFGDAWMPAHKVSVRGHVEIQAAFQGHCDGAVSKTINLPAKATKADVEAAFWMAYEKGCKGITIYRDQSRAGQAIECLPVCADCVT